MEIKNARDLAKIADLCRKKGIAELKIGQNCIEVKMGTRPEKQKRASAKKPTGPEPRLNDSGPTEEELLFWSAGGISTDKQDDTDGPN